MAIIQAMRDLDELIPDVSVLAPKAPEPTIMRAIVAAAQEFCERTSIWKCMQTTGISPPDCIGICSVQGSVIIRIDFAEFGGYELEPKTLEWLDENERGWASKTEVSSARYITQLNSQSVKLYPLVPAGPLSLRLILKPAKNADMLPDVLIDDYSEDIAAGAAGRVLTLPGDWANPQLGAFHLGKFAERMDTLSVAAAKGKQNAPLRSKARWF